MNEVSWLPRCKVVPILTGEEAREVCVLTAESGRLRPSRVVHEDGLAKQNTDICRATIASFFPGTDIYRIVSHGVERQLEAINSVYGFDLHASPEKRIRGVHVAAYDASVRGGYELHTDLGGFIGLEERKITVSILLNDPNTYQGGELAIHNGKLVNVQKDCQVGDGIAFPSFAMHSVSPVTLSQRVVAIVWLEGPRFR